MRRYIGERYVPIVDGAWDITKTYEPLTMVSNSNNIYISKNYVPAGVNISDTDYWALMMNYSSIISEVNQISASLSTKQNLLDAGFFTGDIDNVGGTNGLPAGASVCWVHNTEASGGQPPAEYYVLETFTAFNGIIIQRATQFIYQGSPVVYTRMFVNNTWDAVWSTLLTSSKLKSIDINCNIYNDDWSQSSSGKYESSVRLVTNDCAKILAITIQDFGNMSADAVITPMVKSDTTFNFMSNISKASMREDILLTVRVLYLAN